MIRRIVASAVLALVVAGCSPAKHATCWRPGESVPVVDGPIASYDWGAGYFHYTQVVDGKYSDTYLYGSWSCKVEK